MNQKRKVLIVDDHALVREGLKSIIESDTSYQVVGEAGTCQDGLQKSIELQPELIVVDISLPDRNGIYLTSELKKQIPETTIIIVSMHSRGTYVAEAFKAGALGYISKNSTTKKLLHAFEVVLDGAFYIDSAVSSEVVGKISDSDNSNEDSSDALYKKLSLREQEVMKLLVEDTTVREIARRLFLSSKTIENHRTKITKKLNCHSTIELVRYAMRIGLIDMDSWKQECG